MLFSGSLNHLKFNSSTFNLTLITFNLARNIFGKIKKPGKSGQNQKTLISVVA